MSIEDHLQLEREMDRYLRQYPYDTDSWLKLTVLVLVPGIADYLSVM